MHFIGNLPSKLNKRDSVTTGSLTSKNPGRWSQVTSAHLTPPQLEPLAQPQIQLPAELDGFEESPRTSTKLLYLHVSPSYVLYMYYYLCVCECVGHWMFSLYFLGLFFSILNYDLLWSIYSSEYAQLSPSMFDFLQTPMAWQRCHAPGKSPKAPKAPTSSVAFARAPSRAAARCLWPVKNHLGHRKSTIIPSCNTISFQYHWILNL